MIMKRISVVRSTVITQVSRLFSRQSFLLLAFLLFACQDEEPNPIDNQPSANESLNLILANVDELVQQERFDEALVLANEAVEDYSKEPAAFVSRGEIFTNQEAYANAEADFDFAISLDEEYASAYLGRGIMFRDRAEYDAAAADFDHALELAPALSDAHVQRGILHELQGDPAAAFQAYGEAIQLNPENDDAYYQRGTLLFTFFQDDSSALADFNRALAINEDDLNSLISRAIYYIVQEDWAPAQADIDRAFELGTNAAKAYTMRAVIGQGLGNSSGVLEDFDRAVQIDPGYWQGYQWRMLYYLDQSNWRAALDDAERITELAEGEATIAYAYYVQGLVNEIEYQDYFAARDAYNQAVNLAPDDAFFHAALADLYLIYLDDYQNAIAHYDRVVDLEPGNADAYFARGAAYFQLGIPNDERPISDFSQYLRLSGGSDPQKAEIAQQAIDELTITIQDVFVGTLIEGFLEGLTNPGSSSSSDMEQDFFLRTQYFNPQTGAYQDNYCSGCSQSTTAVPVN